MGFVHLESFVKSSEGAIGGNFLIQDVSGVRPLFPPQLTGETEFIPHGPRGTGAPWGRRQGPRPSRGGGGRPPAHTMGPPQGCWGGGAQQWRNWLPAGDRGSGWGLGVTNEDDHTLLRGGGATKWGTRIQNIINIITLSLYCYSK